MDFINNFEIDPVALQLGPLVIRWYSLAYFTGFILGWQYCVRLVKGVVGMRPNKDDIDEFLTWAIIGVILGGRLGYVLFYNSSYYFENPIEILKIWHGGMSFHGGAFGVLVAMVFFSRKYEVNLLRLSDVICAAAPIGLFFGRMANFINGELFGRITDASWGVVFRYGGDLPRHPSQIYEAITEGLVLFIVIFFVWRKFREIPGISTGVFLIGYGTFRFLIEYVREPDANIGLIGDFISMGQILCLPMIIGGVVLILYSRGKYNGSK